MDPVYQIDDADEVPLEKALHQLEDIPSPVFANSVRHEFYCYCEHGSLTCPICDVRVSRLIQLSNQ